MDIREPTVADADQLGEIHVRAWRAAYRGGLMPDAYLDELSVEDRAEMWRSSLVRPPRPRVTRLVGDVDGQPVGFIVVGPREGVEDAELGEVYALNVDPRAWGAGHGRALLAAGVEALTAARFTEAVLWVHPENLRARRFYEGAGWRLDDVERRQLVLGVEVPEVRYRRSLSAAVGDASASDT